MSGYYTKILTHPAYIHSRVFNEVDAAFEGALADLGWLDDDGVCILFGANLACIYPELVDEIPPEAIIVQLEARGSPWLDHPAYLKLLDTHPVLEYDPTMVGQWRNARYCPIRYHRTLTRLRSDVEKTNDVLFYGGINSRREEILKAVQETGLRCSFLDHRYWNNRDEMIERSKVVLNIHYYPDAPLEMVRLSYLLANGAFVLTEGPVDPQFGGMMAFVYPGVDAIVAGCKHWVSRDNERALVAKNGFERFQRMLQADSLRACLDAPQMRRYA